MCFSFLLFRLKVKCDSLKEWKFSIGLLSVSHCNLVSYSLTLLSGHLHVGYFAPSIDPIVQAYLSMLPEEQQIFRSNRAVSRGK